MQTALELYHVAASQGHAEAQYDLDQCYENGIGMERDEQKAMDLYESAAELGVANAQFASPM